MHHCYTSGPYYHYVRPSMPGLVDLVGGVMNLAVAALYGSGRMVRTALEGPVWYGVPCGCEPYHHQGGCCGGHHHGCCVECLPPVYSCCCCC